MKLTDERIDAVLGRARAHEAAARRRRQRVVALGGGVLSVVAVIAAGIGVSSAMGDFAGVSSATGQLGLMGSVFSGSSALGYIVVGLLGLVLGLVVAAIVFRLGRGRSALAGGDNEGLSAHTLPETENHAVKAQMGKSVPESVRANSREASDEERRGA